MKTEVNNEKFNPLSGLPELETINCLVFRISDKEYFKAKLLICKGELYEIHLENHDLYAYKNFKLLLEDFSFQMSVEEYKETKFKKLIRKIFNLK